MDFPARSRPSIAIRVPRGGAAAAPVDAIFGVFVILGVGDVGGLRAVKHVRLPYLGALVFGVEFGSL